MNLIFSPGPYQLGATGLDVTRRDTTSGAAFTRRVRSSPMPRCDRSASRWTPLLLGWSGRERAPV